MIWRRAGIDEFPAVLSFLQQREWSCVSLTSRLLRAGESGPTKPTVHLVRRDDGNGAIAAVLYVSSSGLVIPVFENGPGSDADYSRYSVPKELQRRWIRLHSIMGVKEHVLHVERHLHRAPAVSIEYHIMEWKPGPETGRPARFRDLLIRRAYPDDSDLLYPLQEAYEKEEVLIRPDRFDPLSCLLHLQESLRNQLVYLAETDGRAVAKAGTNARGILYDQLGGIYTRPEYRNRGIGERILREMLGRLTNEGRRVTLFVKQENEPAISLYRKLRFSLREEFRISYYI